MVAIPRTLDRDQDTITVAMDDCDGRDCAERPAGIAPIAPEAGLTVAGLTVNEAMARLQDRR
jgi:hypothetical protein